MSKLETIMLIDDDDVNNFIGTKVIGKALVNSSVLPFTEARTALDYLKEADQNQKVLPDLIFLDLNMPGMSGWEFIEEYRDWLNDQEKKIVLIVFSSSVFYEDVNRAKAYEVVNEYRSKPISVDLLNELNEKYFEN